MSIQGFDVEKIANLAKLKLSDEEKEKFGNQLGDILSYMDRLKEVDTENVEPLRHVLELETPLREDVVKPSLGTENALLNAPNKGEGYFKTPKAKD